MSSQINGETKRTYVLLEAGTIGLIIGEIGRDSHLIDVKNVLILVKNHIVYTQMVAFDRNIIKQV